VDTQYPFPDRVRFYLLAYDGLRLLEADRLSLERGTSEYSALFDQGQVVLGQIRKVYNQMQKPGPFSLGRVSTSWDLRRRKS
jgi:hypothetical protein